MKIQSVQMAQFFALKEKRFTFSKPFELVYGQNEAGKTTFMKGVLQLFFGIEKSEKGALLAGRIDREGEELVVEREKGRRKTVATSRFEALLHIEKAQFLKSFAVTRKSLEEGTELLLKSKGNAFEVLYGTLRGISQVHDLLQSLRLKEMDLFKVTSAKTQIGKKVEEYQKLQKERLQSYYSYSAYENFQSKREQLKNTRVLLEHQNEQLKKKLETIQRLDALYPYYLEKKRLLQELDPLLALPEISLEDLYYFKDKEEEVLKNRGRLEMLVHELERLQFQKQDLQIHAQLLQEQKEILELLREKKIRDRYAEENHFLQPQLLELEKKMKPLEPLFPSFSQEEWTAQESHLLSLSEKLRGQYAALKSKEREWEEIASLLDSYEKELQIPLLDDIFLESWKEKVHEATLLEKKKDLLESQIQNVKELALIQLPDLSKDKIRFLLDSKMRLETLLKETSRKKEALKMQKQFVVEEESSLQKDLPEEKDFDILYQKGKEVLCKIKEPSSAKLELLLELEALFEETFNKGKALFSHIEILASLKQMRLQIKELEHDFERVSLEEKNHKEDLETLYQEWDRYFGEIKIPFDGKVFELYEKTDQEQENQRGRREKREELFRIRSRLEEIQQGLSQLLLVKEPLSWLIKRFSHYLQQALEKKARFEIVKKEASSLKDKKNKIEQFIKRVQLENQQSLLAWPFPWDPNQVDPETYFKAFGEMRVLIQKRQLLLEKQTYYCKEIQTYDEKEQKLLLRVHFSEKPLSYAVEKLEEELKKEKEIEKLGRNSLEIQKEIQWIQESLKSYETKWALLLAQTGIRDGKELELLEMNLKKKNELERRLCEIQLILGDHEGQFNFETYVESDFEKSQLQESLIALRAALEKHYQEEGIILHEMKNKASSTSIQSLDQKIQSLEEEIKELSLEYQSTLLARLFLEKEMKTTYEQHQHTFLKRANTFLEQLTLGRYTQILISLEDPLHPILQIQGNEIFEVKELSEGTTDQLYLALRLSALEEEIEKRGPYPLLLDDILVHFDDERAKAAIRILSDFSKKTQVFFLTHHRHIVEMVRKTVSSDLLGYTEL